MIATRKDQTSARSNQPTDQFGPCPICKAPESRIVWGWHGVHYDMRCTNGHDWTYEFEGPRRVVDPEPVGT